MDIETAPGVGWETFENAALDHHRNAITAIGVWGQQPQVLRPAFDMQLVASLARGAVWHNGKWDFKTLITKGAPLTSADYINDTMLMAVAYSVKIPEEWLLVYEAKRKELNKQLGGAVHREGSRYSLKCLAPYFLGVPAFWEAADHSDEAYVLKDVEYTCKLYDYFKPLLEAEGSFDFYQNKLIPWARMLLDAELKGVRLDMEALPLLEAKEQAAMAQAEKELNELWAPVHQAYKQKLHLEMCAKYGDMLAAAQAKAAAPTPEKLYRIEERYASLLQAAVAKLPEKVNLNSPAQLKWALRDCLKLDIEDIEGKTEDGESTGKAVLQGLAAGGRGDIAALLRYREHSKLVSAFFPSYRAMQWNGRIHTSFNLNGTRTGRLSSNGPNMQQVDGGLHCLITASPGKRLICYDAAGIEPVVLAFLSEDPNLCRLLIDGGNFHTENLRRVFGLSGSDKELKAKYGRERDLMKEVGLAILYGAGYNRVRISSIKWGLPFTESECRRIVKEIRSLYRGVWEYKQELDEQLANGAFVRNILGRPIRINNPQDVYMKGLNTLVQSSGSDVLLEGVLRTKQECALLDIDYSPLLFVHDETIGESSEAEKAEAVLLKHLTGWKLSTQYGDIPMKAEGGIYDTWEKG